MVEDIGSFEARKTGDSGSHAPYPDALKAYVDAFPDQTLAERARHLQGSTFCIWYGLKRINCTRKKHSETIRSGFRSNAVPIAKNLPLLREIASPVTIVYPSCTSILPILYAVSNACLTVFRLPDIAIIFRFGGRFPRIRRAFGGFLIPFRSSG